MMCSEKKSGGLKWLLIGMAGGVAVGMIGQAMLDSNKKMLQKKTRKVVDAMENLADSAKDMFK